MGRLLNLRGDPHDETQRLLPWHVTGQLDPADRLLVDAHLVDCAACRAEVAIERRLQALVHAASPTLHEQSSEQPSAIVATHGWRAAMRRPVRVAWFVAAQAAVVVLCVGIMLVQRDSHRETQPYHTLGDATANRSGNLLVLFAPGTSIARARQILRGAGAQRIDGPTAAGAFLLLVPAAERASRAGRLATQPGVVAVQPIDQPPT